MVYGRTVTKPWLFVALAGVLLAGCQPEATPQKTANAAPAPVPVDVFVVKNQPVEVTSTLPGRTSAYRIAEVRPQVRGIVTKRLFVEGSQVKKGDILFILDDSTYAANLASAKANLAKAEATLVRTDLQAKRYSELVAKKAISQQDYEDAQATYKEALASVSAAQANVHAAQIDLDYTRIKAPISGQIGRSLVTEGALVTANQAEALATIQQLDPLYVDLSQPSNALLKLRQSAGSINSELGGIKLFLDNGEPIKEEARLQFADVTVNENTGTVNVRALIDNPNGFLLPGLYVRAAVPTEFRENAILVPQSTVAHDARGQASVLLVNDNNTVEQRHLILNGNIGNQWLVESGLQTGDKIIIGGLQKVRPGSPVIPSPIDSTKE